MSSLDVEVRTDRLAFRAYPFVPASVYPSGEVAPSAIRDHDPYGAPPEVRLHTGETLFIPGGRGAELKSFGQGHAAPLVRRTDVWDLLLEPFVDTEFDEAAQRRTEQGLLGVGVSLEEIAEIRNRFGPAMRAYNGVLWDWAHLGLYDLVHALGGALTAPELALDPDAYRDTYWWAMGIADRGA
jgi:hypothetical protein